MSKRSAAFVAGIVACVGLVVLLRTFGWSPGRTARGYPYTSALQGAFVPVFVILGPLVAAVVARWSGQAWPFAAGMIVPFAAALVAEVIADPTNHNLFPFEILFMWLPAFLLSWGGGALGLALAKRGR